MILELQWRKCTGTQTPPWITLLSKQGKAFMLMQHHKRQNLLAIK